MRMQPDRPDPEVGGKLHRFAPSRRHDILDDPFVPANSSTVQQSAGTDAPAGPLTGHSSYEQHFARTFTWSVAAPINPTMPNDPICRLSSLHSSKRDACAEGPHDAFPTRIDNNGEFRTHADAAIGRTHADADVESEEPVAVLTERHD